MDSVSGGGSCASPPPSHANAASLLLTSCSMAVGSSTASSPSTLIRLLILTLGLGGSSRPCLQYRNKRYIQNTNGRWAKLMHCLSHSSQTIRHRDCSENTHLLHGKSNKLRRVSYHLLSVASFANTPPTHLMSSCFSFSRAWRRCVRNFFNSLHSKQSIVNTCYSTSGLACWFCSTQVPRL